MLKRMLGLGLAASLIAGIIIGCGSSNNPTPTTPTGSVYLFVEDTPVCDVLTFRSLITGLQVRRAEDNSLHSLLGSNSAFKVNFASLRDSPSILALGSLPEGTYDQATVTFTSPTIVLFDNTRNPPIRTVSGTIAAGSTLQFPIEPNLVVSHTQISTLQWDFDLLHSIQVDTSGNVTGALTPTMTFSTLTASVNQGFGEMDDLIGFVNKVSANAVAGTAFAGTIGMQFFSNSVASAGGPSLNINLFGTPGAILSATIPNPSNLPNPSVGAGYQVGDVLSVSGGGGTGGAVLVAAVCTEIEKKPTCVPPSGAPPAPLGAITGVLLTGSGTGYATTAGASTAAVVSANGSGATFDITAGTAPEDCFGPPVLAGQGQYCNSPLTNQLLTDAVIEVDGFVDSNGNLESNTVLPASGSPIVNKVEAEDVEDPANNQLAAIGTVTSITTDALGNATSFGFYVRDEEPDDSSSLPLDQVVTVSISTEGPACVPILTPPPPVCSTVYDVSARSTNFAGLAFGPSAIWPGQELIVSGVFANQSIGGTSVYTMAARKIVLKLQTHQGSFVSLLQADSDDKTGAFQFACCNDAFSGKPLLVFTNGPNGEAQSGQTVFAQTQFVNVGGLNALTGNGTLLIKGILFYENEATTINGIQVPAGTFVMLAKEVHQL